MTHPPAANAALRALAGAALEPGLGGVLALDAPADELRALADGWVRLIAAASGSAVEVAVLNSAEPDESVWGTWAPGGPDRPLRWVPGLLTDRPAVVVIPDLAALELPALRACVAAVGADVLHLERAGRSERWRPDLYWLAGCRRSDVGRVSPHLLDRFPVRLDGERFGPGDLTGVLRAALTGATPVDRPEVTALCGLLALARDRHPTVNDQFLDRVLERTAAGPGMRRPLTLARLAVAEARLAGAGDVGPAHVDAAADVLGLSLPAAPGVVAPPPEPAVPNEPASAPVLHRGPATSVIEAMTGPDAGGPTDGRAVEPESPVVIPAIAVGAAERPSPYVEDTAEVNRDPGSLRFPALPFRRPPARRGAVIGSLPTTDFRDLALTPTLLEAAKYSAVRGHTSGRLVVAPGDLRRNRRAPAPDHLFVLVLDHTATPHGDWTEAVLPYLHRAYVDRAAVGIVQVGVTSAPNELRASFVRGRNLLAPAVAAALAATPGTATPLAHGLDLALEAVRRGLHRGRDAATRATLVVYTDGRGNVPLEASRAGRLTGKVGRAGIDDALAVARQFRGLNRLTKIVLVPPVKAFRGLPEELATALGAGVVRVAAPTAEGRK